MVPASLVWLSLSDSVDLELDSEVALSQFTVQKSEINCFLSLQRWKTNKHCWSIDCMILMISSSSSSLIICFPSFQVLSHNLCTVMNIPHDPVALEEHFKDDDEGPVSNQGYMPYLNKFILDKVGEQPRGAADEVFPCCWKLVASRDESPAASFVTVDSSHVCGFFFSLSESPVCAVTLCVENDTLSDENCWKELKRAAELVSTCSPVTVWVDGHVDVT